MKEIRQAEVNIGTIGHVDHGKTSIVKSITGEWVDKHSEEIKRGITIRLGYADADIYFCEKCDKYIISEKCPAGHAAKLKRKISFVDCPGHENLMAVTISGASLMDGAMLIIAANEKCPQPQTEEHLNVLNIVKVKNVVIVQNKIDLVSKEEAKKNYNEIKNFVKNTVAENAPIIPVAANYNLNIEYLLQAIEEFIPTPKRDINKPAKMYIARSFDVNRPGAEISEMHGGVIGGTIVEGQINEGEEIEIRPGVERNKEYEPVITTISSISIKEGQMKNAVAGGLVAVGTLMDPSTTKNDKMVGNVAGKPGTLPPVSKQLKFTYHKFSRVIGDTNSELRTNDIVVVNAGTAMSSGTVKGSGKLVDVELKRPFCIGQGEKIGISKRAGGKWALVGYGEIS